MKGIKIMAFKGFILFRDAHIPFIIEDYRMELFTDDLIINDFTKEYNHKTDYVLTGQCYYFPGMPSGITILVNYSMGTTCYLTSFLFCKFGNIGEYDKIGFQSCLIDSVFQYTHNFINGARNGTNYSSGPVDVYSFSVPVDGKKLEFKYIIGPNNKIGIAEDYGKKGELLVSPCSGDIFDCTRLMRLLDRFLQFASGFSGTRFKYIIMYKGNMPSAYFYCHQVDSNEQSNFDGLFYGFDVMKYCPKILANIALDLDEVITNSIPVGHLLDKSLPYTPHRLVEQVFSFEYLFGKVNPNEAKKLSLKEELKMMFDKYPQILAQAKITSEDAAEEIKTMRVDITHGYKYYYNFNTNHRIQLLMIMLDKLIEKISLQYIGFEPDDIQHFRKW